MDIVSAVVVAKVHRLVHGGGQGQVSKAAAKTRFPRPVAQPTKVAAKLAHSGRKASYRFALLIVRLPARHLSLTGLHPS